MTTLLRFTSLLALCFAGLLAAPASADTELPLSEHVPASAMVYAAWHGADEMRETYDQSTLKAVLEDAGIRDRWTPLFRELLVSMKQEMEGEPPSEQREQAMKVFELAEAMPEVAWRRPWAVYVTDFDLSGEEPVGQMGFIVDAGPMREQVLALVDAVVDAAREQDDTPVEKIDRDGVVGLVLGHALPEQQMGFAPANLPERTVQRPAMLVYADVAAGFDLLERGIRKDEGEEDAEQALAVLDALGFLDMQSFVYMAGFEGRDWRTDLHVLVPAPRRGVFAMLEGRPLGDEDWQLLPATATWATLFRFDPDDVMALIREAIAASGEDDALEEFNEGLARASQEIGIDIEKDIIAPLGDTWAIYSEPTFATGFGPGVCLIHNADDGAQLERMLDAARERINQMLRDEGPGMQITEMDMGGIEISSLSLPFVGVSWAVKDDRFYFAMSPNAVLTAHQAAGDSEQSLANSEKFQAVVQRLENLGAGENVISLTFTDLEQTAPRIYPTYAMLLNLASGPLLQETGINAMTLLPPLGAILPHLEPAGSVTWFDDEGLHSLTVQPFPGSELLSPEATWSYTSTVSPVVIGMTLPAVGAARKSARQSVSLNNLRQIVVAMMAYSADHEETIPSDLASLEPYMPLKEVLRSPSAPDADAVADPPAGENVQQRQVEDTRRWSSYVLIPWNRSLNELANPSETLAVFEKPAHAADEDEVGTAFLDGHVEQMSRESADRLLRVQTGVSLDKWVEAAEAGKVPEGFDPDQAPGEATEPDAVEVQARPAEDASGSTAPPAPR